MNVLTDSIWYYGHLDNIETVDHNKKLFKYTHNKDNLSGKVNVCLNKNVSRKHWSKSIPLAKYLLDNEKIIKSGHYYVNYIDGKQYSIFYKNGIIYPFSDRVCNNDVVNCLLHIYEIEDSFTLDIDEQNTTNNEMMVNRYLLMLVTIITFIALALFTANLFNG